MIILIAFKSPGWISGTSPVKCWTMTSRTKSDMSRATVSPHELVDSSVFLHLKQADPHADLAVRTVWVLHILTPPDVASNLDTRVRKCHTFVLVLAVLAYPVK